MSFPPTSRYYGIETATLEGPNSQPVIYLRRRFLPPLEGITLLTEHSVIQGERLDNITAAYLGDPEAFWHICDANTAMHPDELTSEVGRRVNIPLIGGA
jgi:hypothetical protein